MVKRSFRLTSSTDFQRVRHSGKSFAHPLLVLIVMPNDEAHLRVGISASRAVGNAVQRNRVKRRVRAAVSESMDQLSTGWDLVILARKPLLNSSYSEIQAALNSVLHRAGVVDVEVNGL